jgi:protein FAM50
MQMQKRKKRRVRGDSRLSFRDDIENGSDEDGFERSMLL